MVDFAEGIEAQLAQGAPRRGILFRVSTSTPVRLWSGFGDIDVEPDGRFETEAATYIGLGELTGLDPLNALVNARAQRVSFRLYGPGIDDTAWRLFSAGAADVRLKSVRIAELYFDEDYQPAGPPVPVWRGLSDVLKLEQPQISDIATRTVELSVGTIGIMRRRPRHSFVTDIDQKREHPTDRIFDRTQLINQGTQKAWPPN